MAPNKKATDSAPAVAAAGNQSPFTVTHNVPHSVSFVNPSFAFALPKGMESFRDIDDDIDDDLFRPFRPLKSDADLLPQFPVEALPPVLADMVAAEAAYSQTDPGMAATIGLGILASACQRRYIVADGAGHTEPVNLYVLVVATPAERKSCVLDDMADPLNAYQDYLFAADEDRRQIVTNDATTEAIETLLAQNGGAITICAAEGGIFGILAGRYTHNPSLDAWLAAHSGDDIIVNRVRSDRNAYLRNPAMTAIIAAQPIVLDEALHNNSMTGRGLLARFLVCFPHSRVGSREYCGRPLDPGVVSAYRDQMMSLFTQPIPDTPTRLTLSDEAADKMTQFFAENEHYLITDGLPLQEWAGKLVGAVHRIAGLFHIMETATPGVITATEAENAIKIGRYYRTQAEYAFTVFTPDSPRKKALAIFSKIPKAGIPEAQLYQSCRQFRWINGKKETFEPLLDLLVDHGYIARICNEPTGKPGKPPSPTIIPNPICH